MLPVLVPQRYINGAAPWADRLSTWPTATQRPLRHGLPVSLRWHRCSFQNLSCVVRRRLLRGAKTICSVGQRKVLNNPDDHRPCLVPSTRVVGLAERADEASGMTRGSSQDLPSGTVCDEAYCLEIATKKGASKPSLLTQPRPRGTRKQNPTRHSPCGECEPSNCFSCSRAFRPRLVVLCEATT
jgi:hypothetical protein